MKLRYFSAIITFLAGAPVFLWLPIAESWLWKNMQLPTSFGMVLVALALSISPERNKRAAFITSGLVTLAGILALLQHLVNWELGIHSFLFYQGHLGRMAPNTALSFFAVGMGLLLGLKNPFTNGNLLAGLIYSSIPLCLGLYSLLREMTSITWVTSVYKMAPGTAIPFVAVGVVVTLEYLKKLNGRLQGELWLVRMGAPFVLSFITLAVWVVFQDGEYRYIKTVISGKMDSIAITTKVEMEEAKDALTRFAKRVEYFGTNDKKYLGLDAENYLKQISKFKRIGLADPSYKVFWSYPKEIAHQIAGFNQGSEPERKRIFDLVKATNKVSLSALVNLKSGGRGYLLPIALYPNRKFNGFLYATVSPAKLFSIDEAKLFQIKITDADETVFSSDPVENKIYDLRFDSSFSWGGRTWNAEIVPSSEFVIKNTSRSSYLFLCLGLFLCHLFVLYFEYIITERDRFQASEERERNLTERLNLSLAAVKMGAWRVDTKSGQVWRSENHDQVFGFAERLPHWDQDFFFQCIIPEDREKMKEGIKEIAMSYTPYRIDFRIQCGPTNEIRWMNVIGQSIRNPQGEVIAMHGIVRDISEEKRNAFELEAATEWRRVVLNAADYAIISADAEGLIKTFNTAAERMLGYSADEMINKQTPGVFHDLEEVINRAKELTEELRTPVPAGFDAFVAKARFGLSDINEWTYIRKDGTRFPVRLSVTRMLDSKGEIAGFMGIAIDLTAQKQAESELAITAQRLERVIEASGQGIWEREFNSTNIQYLNTQGKKLLGFEPDEAISLSQIQELLNQEDRVRVEKQLADHIQFNTSHFEFEYRIRDRKNVGQVRWLRTRGRVEKTNGKPIRTLATFSDCTNEVADRQALKEALQRAESATQAKSIFLASMSHEIRTPLNGVIGMTDLLLESDLNVNQKKYAEVAQQSGTALLTLINDILDFSKIEAGKMEIETTSFELPTLINTQLQIISQKANQKGLKLESKIAPEHQGSFFGDPGRIGQILLNLLSNAVKFTHFGSVTVSVNSGKSGATRFEVKDSGIGLDAKAQARLFQPFVQADASISGKYGGTGLGLAICKRLVEAMGGEIGFKSIYGKGSTFFFEIPLKVDRQFKMVSNSASNQKSVRPASAQRALRILIADDNSVNLLVGQAMVESLGHIAHNAANGLEVLKAIEQIDYDLILMDCQMPEMDGYEAARAIRNHSNSKLRNLKIVALTANAMKEDEEKCIQAGMNDFLSKPIKKEELQEKIEKWSLAEKIAA